MMIDRRALLATLPSLLAAPAAMALGLRPARAAPIGDPAGFDRFLAGVRAEARRKGIAAATLDRALHGLAPNQEVLQRERHQPEFTMTWAHYQRLLITPKRIAAGKAAWQENRALLGRVERRFGVGPGVILGIWGIESSFGTHTGDFQVIDTLATLGFAGTRPGFFRSELIAALRILNDGDITPGRMTGSYAGAMGQPQFMPSSYLHYAVDFTGNGKRNIWTSVPDVLASVANYLARNGWRGGMTWGAPALLPPGYAPPVGNRMLPVAGWERLGVRPARAGALAMTTPVRLVRPAGVDGPGYLVTADFDAIRRYNPSDFYALAVGLVGDKILA